MSAERAKEKASAFLARPHPWGGRAGKSSAVDPGSWRLKERDPAYELGRKMNCLVVACARKAAKEKRIPARPLPSRTFSAGPAAERSQVSNSTLCLTVLKGA